MIYAYAYWLVAAFAFGMILEKNIDQNGPYGMFASFGIACLWPWFACVAMVNDVKRR